MNNKKHKFGDERGKDLIIAHDAEKTMITKEQMKSFFYLATGKLDSNIKIFKKQILLELQDLIELNGLVQEKLKNHETIASVASVNVYFEKNKMMQFGVWREFTDNNWKIPETIQNITMIWDFLINLPHYSQPQRHTLTVKISTDPNPATILPLLFSGNVSEIDSIELKSSPVVCQVDFINHLLSDELINIVDRWVESRKSAKIDTKIKKWIQKNRRLFADIINYSVPLFITGVSLSFLYNYSKNIGNLLDVKIQIGLMYWLLISIVVILAFEKFSKKLSRYIFDSISRYGDFLIFNITNGDKNRQGEIDKKNSWAFTRFLVSFLGGIVINIVSAIIVACFIIK